MAEIERWKKERRYREVAILVRASFQMRAFEERFVLLGYSFQARCLIVSHCYRQPNSVIRLISARRATRQEEEVYWRLR